MVTEIKMDTRGSNKTGAGVMRKRRTAAISKSSSCDGMMVKGKKDAGAKLAKRKKKKPSVPASTSCKSSTKMKKSVSSPAEVHLPSLKMTTGVLRVSHSPQVNPPAVEKELVQKPDHPPNPPKRNLEPLQCVSCSPTRPASSASAVSSSHTATSSSKTDFTLEHCIGSINSLRWENALSDDEEEEKRIEIYKENRRKRYRALLEEQKRLLFSSKEPARIYVSDGPVTQS